MAVEFSPLIRQGRLHESVTRTLAHRIIEASRNDEGVLFPKESEICQQLGVSRTILRESMKVLADKGMVEMKPRAGTQARPRCEWRLLDPDILAWQAEAGADGTFLRDLCEVRLAIEPTAAGFAAVRATPDEIATIEKCLRERESMAATADLEEIINLDLGFHLAVVSASHNPLLRELSGIIRQPIRLALSATSRFRSTVELGLKAHHALLSALRERHPMEARRAAEEVVGLAMLAVEKVIHSGKRGERRRGN